MQLLMAFVHVKNELPNLRELPSQNEDENSPLGICARERNEAHLLPQLCKEDIVIHKVRI